MSDKPQKTSDRRTPIWSKLPTLADTSIVRPVDDDEIIGVTLHLCHDSAFVDDDEFDDLLPLERNYLSAEECEGQFGASDEQIERIKSFADKYNLTLDGVFPCKHMVAMMGHAKDINAAFGIQLQIQEDALGKCRGYRGTIQLPDDLEDIVDAVTGLDDRSAIEESENEIRPMKEVEVPTGDVGNAPLAIESDEDDWAPDAIKACYSPTILAAQPMAPMADEPPPTLSALFAAPTRTTPTVRREVPQTPQPVAAQPKSDVDELGDMDPFQVLPGSKRSFFPIEVANIYNYPKDLDGTGQTVGIIAFQGGCDDKDLTAFCARCKVAKPEIVVEPPDRNRPDNSLYSMEVTANIEVIATVAPGAKIVLYYPESNSSQHFVSNVIRAINDKVHRPSILSISYGSAEGTNKREDMELLNKWFKVAKKMGITICVATGNGGSASTSWDKFKTPGAHVSYPANLPHVLACGGMTLETAAASPEDEQIQALIEREAVFNHLNQCRIATGGGISRIFEVPGYQKSFNTQPNANPEAANFGRGLPDVAANASPQTGYTLQFGGKLQLGRGGTSLAAPMWAALIARINQGLGRRVGFINPYLYRIAQTKKGVFRNITHPGFNGAYAALPDGLWNPCTGLGRPGGTLLLEALRELGNAPEPSEPPPAKDVLSDWTAAFNAKDVAGLVNCYTSDAVLADPAGQVLCRGSDEIRNRFTQLFAQSPQVSVLILHESRSGEWVIQETYLADLGGTSKPDKIRMGVVKRVVDNKIAGERSFTDPAQLPAELSQIVRASADDAT